MKNLFCSLVILLTLGACKPKIIYMSTVPDKFCGCSQIDVFYEIKKAKSATLSASPGDFPETTLDPASTGSAVDSFCETTTITIRAKNSNGTVSATRVVTRVDTPAPNIQRMAPCSGLNWVNVLSGTDYPAENTVITTIEFSPDRAGVLSAFGVAAEVHAGPNVLSEFAGLRCTR